MSTNTRDLICLLSYERRSFATISENINKKKKRNFVVIHWNLFYCIIKKVLKGVFYCFHSWNDNTRDELYLFLACSFILTNLLFSFLTKHIFNVRFINLYVYNYNIYFRVFLIFLIKLRNKKGLSLSYLPFIIFFFFFAFWHTNPNSAKFFVIFTFFLFISLIYWCNFSWQ